MSKTQKLIPSSLPKLHHHPLNLDNEMTDRNIKHKFLGMILDENHGTLRPFLSLVLGETLQLSSTLGKDSMMSYDWKVFMIGGGLESCAFP